MNAGSYLEPKSHGFVEVDEDAMKGILVAGQHLGRADTMGHNGEIEGI
jgi:hypothetical protein